MGLQRFNVDGGVDGSFGDGGQSIFEFGWPTTPHLYFADAMIRQADGKFVLVGGYAVESGPGWNAAIGRFVADDTGPVPPANISFTSSAISVREDAGSVTLALSRSGLSVVSVDYATLSDTALSGLDFVLAQGERQWANGDSSPKTITVDITNDTTVESDEAFMVVLSNPSADAILGSTSTVTVTIMDDDDPPATDPPPVVSNGGGGGVFDWLAVLALACFGWLRTPRFTPSPHRFESSYTRDPCRPRRGLAATDPVQYGGECGSARLTRRPARAF